MPGGRFPGLPPRAPDRGIGRGGRLEGAQSRMRAAAAPKGRGGGQDKAAGSMDAARVGHQSRRHPQPLPPPTLAQTGGRDAARVGHHMQDVPGRPAEFNAAVRSPGDSKSVSMPSSDAPGSILRWGGSPVRPMRRARRPAAVCIPASAVAVCSVDRLGAKRRPAGASAPCRDRRRHRAALAFSAGCAPSANHELPHANRPAGRRGAGRGAPGAVRPAAGAAPQAPGGARRPRPLRRPLQRRRRAQPSQAFQTRGRPPRRRPRR